MPEKYPSPEQHGFSRLETDDEFRKRVNTRTYYTGQELDDYVWNVFRKQRKFIHQ